MRGGHSSRVHRVRRRDGAAVLESVTVLGQQLFKRREQHENVRLPAGISHQTDPPYLALERPQAGADFDAESFQ